MAHITVQLDEALFRAGEQYAHARGTSLDALIGELLKHELARPRNPTVEKFFEWADGNPPQPADITWTRRDLYTE